MEALLMGLRLREGVDLAAIGAATGLPEAALIDRAAAERLAGLGMLALDGPRVTLTARGAPLLDAVLAEIVAVEPVPAG